ncbi:hypothetical protein M0D21_03125 [Aquimarina sp. D1M17]|uniref:hypothetical protein n=1 Tax=Aquimarina acroporae TaxID=2937283 RepID=UPI0020BEEE8B|nr:hypothetical protein [Aquimarina acroporae]MCK8520543.1 hypothetical protein [Aquimarina acroporae]
MKKLLLFFFLMLWLQNYAQSLSKTSIIYEHKDQVVMNNGRQYQILVTKPFYEVNDTSIQKYLDKGEHVLMLNRVLVLKNDDEYKEVIEWVKEGLKFYVSRDIINFKSIDNYISNTNY